MTKKQLLEKVLGFKEKDGYKNQFGKRTAYIIRNANNLVPVITIKEHKRALSLAREETEKVIDELIEQYSNEISVALTYENNPTADEAML